MYLKDHEKIKQIYHIFKQIYYDFLGKKQFQCLFFNMICQISWIQNICHLFCKGSEGCSYPRRVRNTGTEFLSCDGPLLPSSTLKVRTAGFKSRF